MKIFTNYQRIGRVARRTLAALGVAVLGVAATSETFGQDAGGSVQQASIGSQLTHNGQSFRVVSPSTVKTAGLSSSALSNNAVQQVGLHSHGGCQSCGTSCGGSCGSSFGGVGYADVCGPTCVPYQYVMLESLYMDRQGQENYTRAANFGIDSFDYEFAPRLTWGTVPDCVHGWEMSFTGVFEWDRRDSRSPNDGSLTSLFAAGAPIVPADFDAFNGADRQIQTHESEYWSLEMNKTIIGWDVAKILYGVRYIDYDDNYSYTSVHPANNVGFMNGRTANSMIGAQLGLEMLYPISSHGFVDFRSRGGIYLNMVDSDVLLVNDGSTILRNHAEDDDIAGVFELGTGVRYELGKMLTVRSGFEMWYLAGVASATDQVSQVVTTGMGRNIDIDDDVFVFGLTLGAELRF